MQGEELDIERIKQFLSDVGPAADELVDLFKAETRTRIIRMGQLTIECDWPSLSRDAHSLKSSARTYGLDGLADAAGQLEQACQQNSEAESSRWMRVISNTTDTALVALGETVANYSQAERLR